MSINVNNLLPSSLNSDFLKSVLDNTVNKFMSDDDSILSNGNLASDFPNSSFLSKANNISPGIEIDIGNETEFFSFSDLVDRMNMLGIDTVGMQKWMREKPSTLYLPIDYDKFSNYTSYVWIGKALLDKGLVTPPLWNEQIEPEFYTIAKAKETDLIKEPVDLATTRHINLTFNDRPEETFTLTFTSPVNFIIVSSLGQIVASTGTINNGVREQTGIVIKGIDNSGTAPSFNNGVSENNLLKFTIFNGTNLYTAGDKFELTIKYNTGLYGVKFTSTDPSGKGSIGGITSLSTSMFIDGELINNGNRILVKNQLDKSENGIYIVTPFGKWVRSTDANLESHLSVGSKIGVLKGVNNGSKIFTVSNKIETVPNSVELTSQIEFSQTTDIFYDNRNDWQKYNFWVKSDDLSISQLNLDKTKIIQATRPIIEYSKSVSLNSFISNNLPSDSGVVYKQSKTSFNQKPLFDLHNIDGSHTGKVSSIFEYKEDSTGNIDSVLKFRPFISVSGNYTFSFKVQDENDKLLFWKEDKLKTVWQEKLATPIRITGSYFSNLASIAINNVSNLVQNETWNITVINGKIRVVGSKSGELGTFTLAPTISTFYFDINITGTLSNNDFLSFKTENEYFPRFIKPLNDSYVNLNQNVTEHSEGGWLTPFRMFKNLNNKFEKEIELPNIDSHFKDVLSNQTSDNFSPNLGGTILTFDKYFQLMISLLIQKDISVLNIFDFLSKEYQTALSSVQQFVSEFILDYIEQNEISVDTPDIEFLLNKYEQNRAENTNLKNLFSDSTSGITNWPASLCHLGLINKVEPVIYFDHDLGVNVLRHHDGHLSQLIENTGEVLVKSLRQRSGNTKTTGEVGSIRPATPYKKQLWHNTLTGKVYIFDVEFDSTPVNPKIGDKFYDTSSNTTSVLTSTGWVVINTLDQWKEFDLGKIINSLHLKIEQILYFNVTKSANLNISPLNSKLEQEFIKFVNSNNLLPYASIYNPMNAFTWNYKRSQYGKSNWIDVYKNYFNQPGISLSTCRPNLEPWKLLNHPVKPNDWDLNYKQPAINSTLNYENVDYVFDTNVPILSGIPSLDGESISANSTVLLTSQFISSNNGVWIVSIGVWSRSSLPLTQSNSFVILNGKCKKSKWTVVSSGAIDIDPIVILQQRVWKKEMWSMIKINRPGLKICVNEATEELLPPYVNSADYFASNALLNTIPDGVKDDYAFLDNGPIELVWRKTLEFNYHFNIAQLKTDLLGYLTDSWGDSFTKLENIPRISNFTGQLFNVKTDLLHGDLIKESSITENDLSWNSISHSGNAEIRIKNIQTNVFTVKINGTHLLDNDFSDINWIDETSSILINDLSINTTKSFNIGDEFVITTSAAGVTKTFIPVKSARISGLNQGFVDLIRNRSAQTSNTTPVIYFRNWNIKYHYDFNTLVKKSSINLTLDDETVPETAYKLFLNKNTKSKKIWFTALSVQLVKQGSYVTSDSGKIIPKNDASDWEFKILGFNNQQPYVTINIFEQNVFQTFTPLNNSSNGIWKLNTNVTGKETVNFPIIVTGLQKVIDLLNAYATTFTEITSIDDSIDTTTGRANSWLLEIEKFINTVYTGMDIDSFYSLNPFTTGFKIKHATGILGEFSRSSLIDFNVNQACYDLTGETIGLENLTVIRTDNESIIRTSRPIFSAMLFLDTYSHLLVFNDKISESTYSKIVFNDFLGVNATNFYLNCQKSRNNNKKPTYNGMYLDKDLNFRDNIVSATTNISNYYDTNNAAKSSLTRDHSLALLGFKNTDYFKELNIDPGSEFVFWKSFIQSKGTASSLDAMSNYKKYSSLSIDECWAYKLAEYGDSRKKNTFDFKIFPNETLNKFSKFQITDAESVILSDFTTISKTDVDRWGSFADLENDFTVKSIKKTETVTGSSSIQYPLYVKLKNIFENYSITTSSPNCVAVNSQVVKLSAPGTYTVTGSTWPDVAEYSPINLITASKDMVDIGLWHPALNYHNLPAQSILDFIGPDPAIYSHVVDENNNGSFITTKHWGKSEVGTTYWDKSNLAYVPYWDSQIFNGLDLRLNRWGKMAGWASLDLYTWIESDVPPKEYKGSGKPGNKKSYYRNRIIKRRPIAWSYVENGNQNGHPAFGSANFTSTIIADNYIYANTGRLSQLGIIEDVYFGAWDRIKNVPLNEVKVLATKAYLIGSENNISTPVATVEQNFTSKEFIKTKNIGQIIGKITLVKLNSTTVRMVDSSGFFEDVSIQPWAGDSIEDLSLIIEFAKFGLSVKLNRTKTTIFNFSTEDLIRNITMGNDVYIREGIEFKELVPFPADAHVLINDELDANISTSSYGWKKWNKPTQEQLSKDLKYPNNSWLAYYGEFAVVKANANLIEELDKPESTLTLASGSEIKYFDLTWSSWFKNERIFQEKISNGSNLSFILQDELITKRIAMYVNGTQISADAFTVTGSSVTLNSSYPEGYIVTCIYLPFSPSEDDFKFNPDIKDDRKIQTQYKEDYSYSVTESKDESGNRTIKKYYFWIEDSNVNFNKKYSLENAKKMLTTHEGLYFVLHNYKVANSSYDSVCISGLDLYSPINAMIRIKNDLVLKDDPKEMNLKNKHTEWALIRKGQSTKIFSDLWDKLTDSTAGVTAGGRIIPDQIRIDYDNKYNTSERYGFEQGQILADSAQLRNTIKYTILNLLKTKKVGNIEIPDSIIGLNYAESDKWFDTSENCRITMNNIWKYASTTQINTIFFTALDDIIAKNYQMTHLFKTSYISADVKLKG